MKNFTMMKLFHLVLSWSLLTWTIVSASDCRPKTHPTDEIIFQITHEYVRDFDVPLRKADSYLANENVPVWTVQGDQPDVLIPSNEIMTAVGPMTMYQNGDLSAAAVYFRNLRKFYGTIDFRLILNGVSFDDINNKIEMRPFDAPDGLMLRHPDIYGHRNRRSTEDEDQLSIHHSEIIEHKYLNDSQSIVRLQRDLTEVYYVKVLLIVDHDLVKSIKNYHGKEFGIVHYLLTLFNSVDMLYSKLNEPNLKINIAGIIILNAPESFPSYASCYKSDYVELYCISNAVEESLRRYSKVISPDSYNIAIFLTSHNVGKDIFIFHQKVTASTSTRLLSTHDERTNGVMMVPIIGVQQEEHFRSFPVIAHEMAHALKDESHDSGPYMNEDNNCCANIMKPTSSFCENCLSWSARTKELLRTWFKYSRDRCFFVNKPPSLKKPGPQVLQSADDQCKCYGYASAAPPKRSLMDIIWQMPLKKRCETNLRCYDYNDQSHVAPYPLDGTPCGEDTDDVSKVCWFNECIPVEKHEE